MTRNTLLPLLFCLPLFLFGCTLNDDEDQGHYGVSGGITYLEGQIVLTLNDNEDLTISSTQGPLVEGFSFRQKLYEGDSYQVKIKQQPNSQYCVISGEEDVISDQSEVDVNVYCRTYYRIDNNPESIEAVGNHTCLIENSISKCFGKGGRPNENKNTTSVPIGLVNPTSISTSLIQSCVIDDTGVVCWGEETDDYSASTIPVQFINPKEVKAGEWFTCVIDDNGVVCWGWDLLSSTAPTDIISASNLRVGRANACLLDNGKPICWGSENNKITAVPDFLVDVVDIYVGDFKACAIQDSKLYCWGVNNVEDIFSIELEPNLSAIYVPGGGLSCLASEETLDCSEQYDLTLMEDFTHISPKAESVSMGKYHMCAKDEKGFVCAGSNASEQSDILTKK